MFKFLKLRNLVSGDARRHVPFTSIIHKPLFVFIALVFSFVVVVPIKVNAAAPQIRPQFKPILDTDIVNFQDSYLNLDPAAQAAASLLFGAYVTEYAGLADYGYVFEEVPTDATLKERLIFIGDQVVDTIFLPYNMADQLVLTPLINLGQGIINKVKGVNSVDDFYDDILDASDYGLSYTPDIGFALNQLFATKGGLYNWQFSEQPFDTNFTWKVGSNIPASTLANYNLSLANMGQPRYLFNSPPPSSASDVYNGVIHFTNNLSVNLLITPNAILCFDDYGNELTYLDWTYHYVSLFYLNGYSIFDTDSFGIQFVTYNYSNSSSITTLLNNYFNSNPIRGRLNGSGQPGNYNIYLNIGDFLNKVYIGATWGNKVEYTNQTDLGFSQTDELQYLNPNKDAVFDLKALIEQIVQAQPDPALELPLKPIIYNITQVEGSPLTAEDLEGISFNVTPPESGIDVPVNAFLPMFDNGKGFISYMWYMTKPLITYTRSLLDALTFDPVDGFNASGPGYFVLGVAGLGLIGGVIVKFLL